MQDLLAHLLWANEEIPEAADRLCRTLPGFQAAWREYQRTAQQIENLVGFSLFDRLQQQFIRCTDYEVRAYYALGLGLREALLRELGADAASDRA